MTTPTIESMVQTVYNLNWKGRRPKDAVESVTHQTDLGEIVIFPNAIDYLNHPFNGKTHQVKWEVNNDRVINLGVIHHERHDAITSILKDYLGYV